MLWTDQTIKYNTRLLDSLNREKGHPVCTHLAVDSQLQGRPYLRPTGISRLPPEDGPHRVTIDYGRMLVTAGDRVLFPSHLSQRSHC